MTHPAARRWEIFARRVLHDVAHPEQACPELADYAADMLKADIPVMALGERAIFSTLRWSAQAFAWSDEARRARLAPAVRVFAEFVLDATAPPKDLPSTAPANAHWLDKDD